MAILGKLVKTGIEVSNSITSKFFNDPHPQEKQLQELLKKASDTAFGKYYGFNQMLASNDVIAAFQQAVPIHEYNDMQDNWWHKQQLHPDITWPGKPDFFALSSGTTGKSSKKIPITEDFLHSMKQVGTSLIKSLANFDLPESVFQSEVLMLGSSAQLNENEYGFKEGEISGINTGNFPGWYDLFYRPGKDIAALPDWEDRLRRIVKEAPSWNIGAIAGIPSWVLLMLQAIVKEHRLESIHEIWPELKLYASGGVAFDTYQSDFQALFSKEVTFLDTYLASEGFFAYTARPGSLDMHLALHHGYFFEFVPFDERGVDDTGALLKSPQVKTINEVEVDQEYVLVASTCSGAWRYVIGDVIKFTSIDPFEIRITGRTKFYLNVVGSQLSEEKMDAAILETSQELGVSVNEYIVAAIRATSGKYIHQWILVSDDAIDSDQFSQKLDTSLKGANKNYAVARSKALSGVNVKTISKNQYHSYLEKEKKMGGQVKTPKVMKEAKMKDLLGAVE